MRIQAPQVRYARYKDGILAGILTAIAVSIAVTACLNYVVPLHDSLLIHLKYWSHGLLKLILGYQTDGWLMYSEYMSLIESSETPYLIKWRMSLVGIASLIAGGCMAWWAGKPISDLTKVSGNDLLRDKEAVKYFNSQSEKDGLELVNGLKLDLNKETEHFLISGGTGSGKTVSAMNILLPAIQRGDRILLINYKGLAEKFPVTLNTEINSNSKEFDAIILCPFDKRSVVWAIWADITTKSHAREFSARVIPESRDPVWSNSARFIMTGILMYLIHNFTETGQPWSWKMFGDLCVADRETLAKLLSEHYPEGLRSIKDEGKTGESVMMNFAAFAAPIIDLAEGWGDRKKGFSIEKWVNSPNHKIRTVILQISSEFKVLSQAFNQSILNQVATYLTRLPDVKASQNSLWIYADEFPRLGKIEVIDELFGVGRSKSMRIMIAIQSIGQLKKEYGVDLAEGWIDSLGTKIMGRQDGQGAKWLSDMCGEAVYTQLQSGRADINGKNRLCYSPPQSYAVFPPQSAQNELGVITQHLLSKFLGFKPKGVRMLIHGTRGADLIVDFPFILLPKLREETELASIFKGGFNRTQNADIESLIAEIIENRDLQAEYTDAKTLISDNQTTNVSVIQPTEVTDLKSQDNGFLDELTKEVSSELIDEATDTNLSLALEAIDFISELTQNDNKQNIQTSVANHSPIKIKRKRYISKRERLELVDS